MNTNTLGFMQKRSIKNTVGNIRKIEQSLAIAVSSNTVVCKQMWVNKPSVTLAKARDDDAGFAALLRYVVLVRALLARRV